MLTVGTHSNGNDDEPSLQYSPSCYDISGGTSRFYRELYKKQLTSRGGVGGAGIESSEDQSSFHRGQFLKIEDDKFIN